MNFENLSDFRMCYEIKEESGDGWVFGEFNILIDNCAIIESKDNWSLNVIFSWLRASLNDVSSLHVNGPCDESAVSLFFQAVKARDYWVSEKNRKFLNGLTKGATEVGVELELYEIQDLGWRLFLFPGDSCDRLVYSPDFGETIYEKFLEIGAVEREIRGLPSLKE